MTTEDKKPRCPKHDTGNGPCYCHLKKVNVGTPGHIDHGKPAEDSTENMQKYAPTDNTITHKSLLEALDYDKESGIFTWKKKLSSKTVIGDKAGAINSEGAEQIKIYKILYKSHRLAWFYVHGEWPCGQIDHINRIPHDNRFINLRVVTGRQNCSNRKNNNKFVGVSWNHRYKKWFATIRLNNKNRYLGSFKTHLAACYARHQANLTIGHKPI